MIIRDKCIYYAIAFATHGNGIVRNNPVAGKHGIRCLMPIILFVLKMELMKLHVSQLSSQNSSKNFRAISSANEN